MKVKALFSKKGILTEGKEYEATESGAMFRITDDFGCEESYFDKSFFKVLPDSSPQQEVKETPIPTHKEQRQLTNLRDKNATEAMLAFLMKASNSSKDVAERSYEMADAMMKAREVKK